MAKLLVYVFFTRTLGTESECLAQHDLLRSEIKVKVNLSMFTTWRSIGAVEVKLHTFLTFSIDVGDPSALCPGRFTPIKDGGYSSNMRLDELKSLCAHSPVALPQRRAPPPRLQSIEVFRRSRATRGVWKTGIICCLCHKSNHDSSVAQHAGQFLYWLSYPGFIKLKKDGEEY